MSEFPSNNEDQINSDKLKEAYVHIVNISNILETNTDNVFKRPLRETIGKLEKKIIFLKKQSNPNQETINFAESLIIKIIDLALKKICIFIYPNKPVDIIEAYVNLETFHVRTEDVTLGLEAIGYAEEYGVDLTEYLNNRKDNFVTFYHIRKQILEWHKTLQKF
jgi:hypothetical protein